MDIEKMKNSIDELYFSIDTTLANVWKAWVSIEKDLRFAYDALLKLKEQDDLIVRKSLWISFVITYGKCFSDARSGRKSKLEIRDTLKNNSQLIKIHNLIMDCRHNFVAHGGYSIFEKIDVRIALMKRDDDSYYPHLTFKGYIAESLSNEKVEEYIHLLDHLHKYVLQKISKTGKILLKEDVEKLSKEEILERIKEQQAKNKD